MDKSGYIRGCWTSKRDPLWASGHVGVYTPTHTHRYIRSAVSACVGKYIRFIGERNRAAGKSHTFRALIPKASFSEDLVRVLLLCFSLSAVSPISSLPFLPFLYIRHVAEVRRLGPPKIFPSFFILRITVLLIHLPTIQFHRVFQYSVRNIANLA